MRCLVLLVVIGLTRGLDQTAVTNQADIDLLLEKHNEARAGVSPPAHASAPIPVLTWNSSYANDAANYLSCEHATQHEGSSHGENLGAVKRTGGYTLQEAIPVIVAKWDNEKADYDLGTNTCAANKVCGHYTQLVWDKTVQVGCAYATGCPSSANYDVVIHCYYEEEGNYQGIAPYVPNTATLPTAPVITSMTLDSTHLSISFTKGLGASGEQYNSLDLSYWYRVTQPNGAVWTYWASQGFSASSPVVKARSNYPSNVHKYEFKITVGSQVATQIINVP